MITLKFRRLSGRVMMMVSRNLRNLVVLIVLLLFVMAAPAGAQEFPAADPDVTQPEIVVNVPEAGAINPMTIGVGLFGLIVIVMQVISSQRREDKLLDRIGNLAESLGDSKSAKDNLELALQSMPPSFMVLVNQFAHILSSIAGAGQRIGGFLEEASDGEVNAEVDLPEGVTVEEAQAAAKRAIEELGRIRALQNQTMKMPQAPEPVG